MKETVVRHSDFSTLENLLSPVKLLIESLERTMTSLSVTVHVAAQSNVGFNINDMHLNAP